MTEPIPPDIQGTFRKSEMGFTSRSASIGRSGDCYFPAPPSIIASAALTRVTADAELDLPWITHGRETEVLSELECQYDHYDVDVLVSPRRASNLAALGSQILTLNEQGNIQPPLQPREHQAISWLISLVGQTTTK